MPKSRSTPPEPPDGPVTDDEVISGIRRMAHGDTADTTRLRAWELLGKTIGLFRDAASEGGAPVVRLTPALDETSEAADVAEPSEVDDDHD